jgi:hypothetical protein
MWHNVKQSPTLWKLNSCCVHTTRLKRMHVLIHHMAVYPTTNICQINQSWKQYDRSEICSDDSGVVEDSGVLECDSVTASSNRVQSKNTAWPSRSMFCAPLKHQELLTHQQYHIPEDLNPHITDTHLAPCVVQNYWHTCQTQQLWKQGFIYMIYITY